MKRIWILVLVCVLSVGVGVTLAQSSSGTQASGSAQGQVSGSASGQAGNNAGTQPPATDNTQTPNNPPAGSNAQAQTDQSGTSRTTAPMSKRGGGFPILWVIIGIVVVMGIIYALAGRSSNVVVDRTERVERVDRDKAA